MPLVGLEPTVLAGKRPQTHALDRAATGIGVKKLMLRTNTQDGFETIEEVDIEELMTS